MRKVDQYGDPVEGWEMTLVQIIEYTDSDGYAIFDISEPGEYTIREETRSGWTPLGTTMKTFIIEEEGIYTHTFENEKIPDFVIPEIPYGTIFSVITMLGGLLLTKKR